MNAPLKHDTSAVRLPTPAGLSDRQREVLEAIRAFPGSTYRQLAEVLVLPKTKSGTEVAVRQCVAALRKRQLVNLERKRVDGELRPFALVFPVTPETPYDPSKGLERRRTKRKTRPVPVEEVGAAMIALKATQHQNPAIMAELAELRAFKAMALERYPDLAVPAVVLRAREICAQTVMPDESTALRIRAGERDGSPMMRATIAALESVS